MAQQHKKSFTARNFFIAVLAFACLLALWWTFLGIRDIYRSEQRVELRDALQHRPAALDDIQPWMTFDYINVLFHLPKTLLQASLGITDHRYPNITIIRYAHSRYIRSQTLIQQIQNAINQYRSGK